MRNNIPWKNSSGHPAGARSRSGSLMLMAVGVMAILFILGFSMSFFSGSEDYASAISYESEVAFNLAESAVEEFVARLKYSLNHDDPNNMLFKVLRDSSDSRINKDIPLDAVQVANLTRYTRESSREIYGLRFDSSLVKSNDFEVAGTIKLNNIPEIKQDNYVVRQDKMEKQGELSVSCRVTFKGRTAKVSLNFLIRVVKIFVPPFNYFTLYVKNGTPFGPNRTVEGGSNFNAWKADGGVQRQNLVLDNGWRQIPGMENFNAMNSSIWEKELAKRGKDTMIPPGRVFLGQNPSEWSQETQGAPSIFLQSTNGSKLLRDIPSDRNPTYHINAQENLFLKPDIPWMGMKDFVKKIMKQQMSDEDVKKGLISPWSNDNNIRIMNIGAGHEVGQDRFQNVPAFNTALGSYKKLLEERRKTGPLDPILMNRLYPDVDKSGLDLFGNAIPKPPLFTMSGGDNDTSQLSPTIVYGPVGKMYYRVVSMGDKNVGTGNGEKVELPYIGTEGSSPQVPVPDRKKTLTATEANMIFMASGVNSSGSSPESNYLQKFIGNWEKLIPKPMRSVDQFEKFMSNVGVEVYNQGLGNFIMHTKLKDGDIPEPYDGELKNHLSGFLDNQPMEGMPGETQKICDRLNSPFGEYYYGFLYYALPDEMSSYLLDFYFIPRSTEDFFRGRTTVSVGGVIRDRFVFKYIDDPVAYESGQPNQTLQMDGILALNDPAPLTLRNLLYRGRGVIYSSPMMGGGPVEISGDFMPAAAKVGNSKTGGIVNENEPDMITIVAPQITIDTDASLGETCYVEANLISVNQPIIVKGIKKILIKGTVAMPYMDLAKMFPNQTDPTKDGGGMIRYNALNTIWRNQKPKLLSAMYIAKIATGGVGKFEWKYEGN